MRFAVFALLFVLAGCVETTRNKSEIMFLRELDSRIGSASDCELDRYIRSQSWILQSNNELAGELTEYLSRTKMSCSDDDDDNAGAGDTRQTSDDLVAVSFDADDAPEALSSVEDASVSSNVRDNPERPSSRPSSRAEGTSDRAQGRGPDGRDDEDDEDDDDDDDGDDDEDDEDDEEDED